MGSLHTERTTRGQLRLVYNDRIVSRWLGADATFGDVSEALSELAPRHYGHPIAIDVTLTDLPAHSPSFDPIPAWLKYEDDPGAEFETTMPPGAPEHSIHVRG